MARDHESDQRDLDREDVTIRLNRLVDAINNVHAATELVRSCRDALKRAESALKSALARERDLSFMERRRRKPAE